ncbi:MAG: aspartyl-tRNA synthetase, partial [Actinomycetota bacterium]|nr:aspartyl-tRNA synthetase [Actinomycetota bacterium]
MMRTHRCGDLRADSEGQTVQLCGWVHSRRDHGGVTFIDLRDTSGLIQVVFNPATSDDAHAAAQELRSEYCIKVTGEVRPRKEGTTNPKLATGEIEVAAQDLEILSRAETPPFQVDTHQDVDEMLRLRYR